MTFAKTNNNDQKLHSDAIDTIDSQRLKLISRVR